MKKFLLFFLIISSLLAVDPDLLAIESKIYPKIVQFDRNLSQKLYNNQIVFSIIYNDTSYHDAKLLKKMLEQQGYPARLEREPKKPLPTAYILTTVPSKKTFQKLLSYQRLIFAIDSSLLPYTIIGLYIGIRIKPYINVTTLKNSRVTLNPVIFRIAKLYE